MAAVIHAFGKSLASQLHLRVLLLTLRPIVLSTVLWSALLLVVLQPIVDAIQLVFVNHDGFTVSGRWLSMIGLTSIKTLIVPLLAMWSLSPLMVMTALIFVGTTAMPAIVRHIGAQYYPALEQRRCGSFVKMLWLTVSSFFIFATLWIVTIPLCALPWVGFIIQPLLCGWLSYRVIAYAVLGQYSDSKEREDLLRRHRLPLLAMGTMTGVLGAAPTLLLLPSTMSVVFYQIFVLLSICLYVLVFTFSVLWFTHFVLASMEKYRTEVLREARQTLSGG